MPARGQLTWGTMGGPVLGAAPVNETGPASCAPSPNAWNASMDGSVTPAGAPGAAQPLQLGPQRFDLIPAAAQGAPPFSNATDEVKNVTIRGTWFNGKTVHIRPHTRDRAGSNQVGGETLTNFSLQVSEQQVSKQQWRSFSREEAGSLISEASTEQVVARFVMREEFGERLEGQALEFRMGEAAEATILISQAAHQALNIDMRHISKLGQDRIGGLLGTEAHDKDIEEDTVECKAEAAKKHMVEKKAEELLSEMLGSSRLKASWL
ncbi:unnamed protein product [Prorocentrum cordatum]|uniref:Uncharacterized protein n=1 Tax=Prorocentrum cordatum TaxID=2364126 RepID=A0ABN9SIV5_9DINO|nr:unnamed protein product [Polarella glacialis]